MRRKRLRGSVVWICAFLLCGSWTALCQESTATAQIEFLAGKGGHAHKNRSNVAVWLTPLDGNWAVRPVSATQPVSHPLLVQRGKRFEPHLLVVPVGTAVEFPNHDPFFHNVFSLFEGKRFDLGLYEAGTSRLVHFDRPGISYIFCNIHPEMSGVVIALKTPYFAVSNPAGKVSIADVPAGRYLMQVWAEGASVENLKSLSKEVTISAGGQFLGMVRVLEDTPVEPHKNLYGRDYDAPGTDYPSLDPK